MTTLDEIQQAAEVCGHCGAPIGFAGNCCRNFIESGRPVGCFLRTEKRQAARIATLEASLSAATARASELERECEAWRKLAEYGSRRWHRWTPPWSVPDTNVWTTSAHGDPADKYPVVWENGHGKTPGEAALSLATQLGLVKP